MATKTTPLSTQKPRSRFYNFPNAEGKVPGQKKFQMIRQPEYVLTAEGDNIPDFFRAYLMRGIVGNHWAEGSDKVARLFPDKSPTLRVVLRLVEKKLLVVVKLEFEEAAVALLDAAGKAKYDRYWTHWKGKKMAVVYLPISGPEDHDVLRYKASNVFALGAWTLERLRPRVIAWAEEHL